MAAGVGPAVQSPEQGILPAIVIAGLVIAIQWSMSKGSCTHERVESLFQGGSVALVIDGRIEIPALTRTSVSSDLLTAKLRASGHLQLRAVERLYLEADGSFSVIAANPPKLGLTLIPKWDDELFAEQARGDELVCARCGAPQALRSLLACEHCESTEWTKGVLPS